MSKFFFSLGLMSGTSGDGVDASIIQSDGDNEYKVILDKYYRYSQKIYEDIHNLKEEINNSKDLKNLSEKIKLLEKEITLFHCNVVNEITKKTKYDVELIGFHGQTIFHNAKEKISEQLGDGELLSKNTKKTVIYDFRKNDIKNGGHGAPLTPIFHKVLKKKLKVENVVFVNIGGIANITYLDKNSLSGTDVGPGMCLIDRWIRHKLNKNYDKEGKIASSGNTNKNVLEKLLVNFYEKEKKLDKGPIKSFDTKYFDFSFVKNLSLEDGAATLTEFTCEILNSSLEKIKNDKKKIILCGGGRKNNFLFKKLKKNNSSIKLIDNYGIDGDFIESQAFAYLAIRSYLNLPISYPETTGVNMPCTGGVIVKY